MKGWLFLVIAIVGEVIATSALKSSEGFTKLAPSAVVIIGYGIAFYFLSLVLKSIPVGVAYAVWSGLGVVIITAIAWLLHGQKLDAWGFVGREHEKPRGSHRMMPSTGVKITTIIS
ncbi:MULTISPECIES: quaternary ammonium compound efflux SMR transporter QacE [Enterobacteriaceae]|uniref:quaternary ammonium compound efflux SMR transporter QacE n=1 Tax=Enterobacteriaceae TaxID=543 RepID=UPI0020B1E0B3|nr:quaternary ammonium compound efflux SMR transporter QacE [Enterobacter hormaechei]